MSTGQQLGPHEIGTNGFSWWYEVPEGIEIIVENRTRDGAFCYMTTSHLIPWSEIRAALRRAPRPRKRAGR